jgi:uncharacterized Zn-binding protein involved in type VI secretion
MLISQGEGGSMGSEPTVRIGDKVDCPRHGTVAIVSGSPDTFINGQPAVRVGDTTSCGDTIIEGSNSVFINGKPAAFLGCATAHGGIIIGGSANVFIGTEHDAAALDSEARQQSNERDYSLMFDFSAMHEAGNHNDIIYVNMPVMVTKPDGTYITTVRTDEYGMTRRIYTQNPEEIIAWVDSGFWQVAEEYESVEDEETLEAKNG